jgi:hypothetical protein
LLVCVCVQQSVFINVGDTWSTLLIDRTGF